MCFNPGQMISSRPTGKKSLIARGLGSRSLFWKCSGEFYGRESRKEICNARGLRVRGLYGRLHGKCIAPKYYYSPPKPGRRSGGLPNPGPPICPGQKDLNERTQHEERTPIKSNQIRRAFSTGFRVTGRLGITTPLPKIEQGHLVFHISIKSLGTLRQHTFWLETRQNVWSRSETPSTFISSCGPPALH